MAEEKRQFNYFSKFCWVFKFGNLIFTRFTLGLSDEFFQLTNWSFLKGTVKPSHGWGLCQQLPFTEPQTGIEFGGHLFCLLVKQIQQFQRQTQHKVDTVICFSCNFFWPYNKIDKHLLTVVQKTRQKHQEIHALQYENHCQSSSQVLFFVFF